MTMTLFLTLFTIGSMASSLLTEAIKKSFKGLSTNIIALINAAIVGLGGTAAAYILMGIPFSLENITCLILMVVCIWIGSMVGYDKCKQTLEQFSWVKKI